MSDTYDFETGIWSAKNKAKTYYRLDYRGQDEPIKQIETKAIIHINAHDIITCIEFENVPFEAHMPHFDLEDAEKHQRESAAMIERERIIELWNQEMKCECENPMQHLLTLIKGEK